MTYTCTIDTPLGAMTAAAQGDALTGLWFIGQKYYPASATWVEAPEHHVFAALRVHLGRYFAGEVAGPEFTLAPHGSRFRMSVWEILQRIPFGRVVTYCEIAREVARCRGVESMSAQAVGGAIGHNPISILIPCHRVVGSDGSLTGYAGGTERKKELLLLEGIRFGADHRVCATGDGKKPAAWR